MKLLKISVILTCFVYVFLRGLTGYSDVICLKNGVRLHGRIIEQDKDYIKIAVSNGAITVQPADVISIEQTEDDFDNVLKEYENRKKEIDPDKAEAYFKLGIFCFNEELYERARTEFEQACCLDQGYKEKTKGYFEKIECIDALNLFFQYYQRKKYTEAVEVLEKVINKYPENHAAVMAARLLDKVKDRENIFPADLQKVQDKDSLNIHFSSAPEQINSFIYTWVKGLNKAGETIDISVGQLDISRVIEALIQARARGVKVRLAVHQTNSNIHLAQLRKSKIDLKVHQDSPVGNTQFCVIDNKYVWLGLMRAIETDLCFDVCSALEITSKPLADSFQKIFESIWSSVEPENDFGQKSIIPVKINDDSLCLYFAYVHDLRQEIINRISLAQDNINFCANGFTDNKIARALIEKNRQGISVNGVFEKDDDAAKTQYKILTKKKVKIRGHTRAGQIRFNVIVIDNKTVLISSVNLDKKELMSEQALLLVIESRTIAREYIELFKEI